MSTASIFLSSLRPECCDEPSNKKQSFLKVELDDYHDGNGKKSNNLSSQKHQRLDCARISQKIDAKSIKIANIEYKRKKARKFGDYRKNRAIAKRLVASVQRQQHNTTTGKRSTCSIGIYSHCKLSPTNIDNVENNEPSSLHHAVSFYEENHEKNNHYETRDSGTAIRYNIIRNLVHQQQHNTPIRGRLQSLNYSPDQGSARLLSMRREATCYNFPIECRRDSDNFVFQCDSSLLEAIPPKCDSHQSQEICYRTDSDISANRTSKSAENIKYPDMNEKGIRLINANVLNEAINVDQIPFPVVDFDETIKNNKSESGEESDSTCTSSCSPTCSIGSVRSSSEEQTLSISSGERWGDTKQTTIMSNESAKRGLGHVNNAEFSARQQISVLKSKEHRETDLAPLNKASYCHSDSELLIFNPKTSPLERRQQTVCESLERQLSGESTGSNLSISANTKDSFAYENYSDTHQHYWSNSSRNLAFTMDMHQSSKDQLQISNPATYSCTNSSLSSHVHPNHETDRFSAINFPNNQSDEAYVTKYSNNDSKIGNIKAKMNGSSRHRSSSSTHSNNNNNKISSQRSIASHLNNTGGYYRERSPTKINLLQSPYHHKTTLILDSCQMPSDPNKVHKIGDVLFWSEDEP